MTPVGPDETNTGNERDAHDYEVVRSPQARVHALQPDADDDEGRTVCGYLCGRGWEWFDGTWQSYKTAHYACASCYRITL